MILYNVTMNVEDEVHDDWMQWIRTQHIPALMNTGLFVEHKMLRLLSETDEAVGTTYAIQYFLKDIKSFLFFTENHADNFQQDLMLRYGNKVIAFRTLLEVVE